MNKFISTKNRVFISLVGPGESGKSQFIYQLLKNDTFQPKFGKTLFLYQHFQPLYDVMLKAIENIEFVQGVNFDFIDSLENNGTKYLLIFDDSCQEICNSREFEKIAVAGRHRGLSTIYIKHNLFHKSKLGRDIELQNTHIVLFKSPRDVLQVGRLSVQLRLGLSLVDWYKDATSVPFGHLLIDLSPRTDDRLRYCTNSGKKPSKFHIPEQLKHLRILDDDHTKSLYSPSIPTLFPQVQNTISPKLRERIPSVPKRMYSEPARRKFARFEKRASNKISKTNPRTFSGKNNLERKTKNFVNKKRTVTNKNNIPIRH